ncbi:MAG: universal stress protein [Anaerolineales bacterium]|nr:MAG: universal stress protein [Anaerolineales bacterium]
MHILISNYHSAETDDSALQCGLALAKDSGADCTLLYVIARPGERQQGHAALQAMQARAEALGVSATSEMRLGLLAEQIVHFANEADSNLIIMGDAKPDVFFGQLLAPPSERVLANAPCPVLIVRGLVRPPRKWLVLHSGQEAMRTLPSLLKSVGPLLSPGTQVTLLHVMSEMAASYSVSGWELSATAEELIAQGTQEGDWLKQGVGFFESYAGVAARPKVRHGTVVEEILAELHEGDYDLVVFGSHVGRGWQELLTDNVAKQLLQLSSVSALVVQRS